MTNPSTIVTVPVNPVDSVWADIGGAFEQNAFDRRLEALTDPKAYATSLATALDEIKKASEKAFKTAYDGYLKAGLGPEVAKEHARNSARSEYGNQLRVFNLQ